MSHISRRMFLKTAMTVAASTATVPLIQACTGGQPAQLQATTAPTAAPTAQAQATTASTEQPTAAAVSGAEQWLPAGYKPRSDEWNRLPTNHKKGTLITQQEWYDILGEVPSEPIDGAFWLEGWGHERWKQTGAILSKEHPGATVNVWGDPRIWDTLAPRIAAGDIPDIGLAWWQEGGPAIIKAIKAQVLAPVDILMDLEAYGQPGKRVEEILAVGALEGSSLGITDHHYAMPFAQTQVGIFYNSALFEKNKWPQPDSLNWDDFLNLNKEIAKTGISPLAFQGKVPGYLSCLTDPLIYKKGGPQAWCGIDNLTPGAWKNPDVIWALEQVQNLIKQGWVQPGSEAMTHTEAQQVFVDGKAAMVPCGTWLKREMEATTPKGFRMRFSGVPAPKDGKGFAKAIVNSPGGADIVTGNGKHPLWAIEFLRLMYSPQIAKYVAEQIGGMLAVKDPLTGAQADESVQSEVAAVEAAQGHYVRYFFTTWYGSMAKVFNDSWGDLAYSKVTLDKYTDNMERAAKETRDDPKTEKHTSPDCPTP